MFPGYCHYLPASSAIDVASFSRFFADKVAKVRSSTSSTPPPTFSCLQSGASFCSFRPTSTVDVINAIRRLPGKSLAADPLPTPVLKEVAEVVVPFVSELFNRSLSTGYFPTCFKEAFITPVIKKPGLGTLPMPTRVDQSRTFQ